MVTYAFDLGMWTLLFFLVGMYNPQWPLFFLKKSDKLNIEHSMKKPDKFTIKPDRFLILIITTVLVMIALTLYGEGTRREKIAQKEAKTVAPGVDSTLPSIPAAVPAPAPSSDKPKTEK
ncbi:MAG: hypothetical protein LUO95_09825 [Methylococcaceae bacterium]|nr:hypothetical protein [Methylococcaceae bacterium]MDD1608233.1 hypothetical protein [Methylococcaceae bacterium]MDD1610868.1 hypothetical protein [Methylococcaceae bacterium]MDD1616701.1 hypothetical protein [Methylococcaceae bacterium]OYV17053.1 MAG: hypothetical protein CG439_1850 [Methylococcaceae bacterium NSP1-2]